MKRNKNILVILTVALGFLSVLAVFAYFHTPEVRAFESEKHVILSPLFILLLNVGFLLIVSIVIIYSRLIKSINISQTSSLVKQQASEETNKKLRQVFAQAPVAMCVLRGKEYIVEIANNRMLELWGITEEETINQPIFKALSVAAGQGFEELLNRVYETGTPFLAEEMHIILLRNNIKRDTYLNFVYEPSYNLEGVIDGVMCVATDVTEQVTSRKKIEENQKLYHNLVYSSPSAIGILEGERLIITMANEAIMQIWGKGKDVFGKSYFEMLPELAEQGYREVFNHVFKTGEVFNAVETPVEIVQDGIMQLRYYNFILFPQFNVSNAIVGIGIIATEVTSQAEINNKIKESEESFRTLAQTLPQLIWVTDENGKSQFASSRWEEYTGVVPAGEMEWREIVHPDDYDGITKVWTNSLSTATIYSFDVRLKSKLGEYRWHRVKGEPVRNKDGNVYKWIGAFTEVHEEKAFTEKLKNEVEIRTQELKIANQSLETYNTELAKMNKELQSFAYISSHDLQEPLRKIQTFVTRIMEKEYTNMSDAGKDYFNRMHIAAKRMQTLIDDLLAYSRTNTNERKFEKTNLNVIVNEIREDLQEEIKSMNATIETAKMCDLDIIPFQFRQLLHNLIGNSLKFSKKGVPTVINIASETNEGRMFKYDKLTANKKYCHITFTDNGIGFDSQYSEKIFEVFQRLHGKTAYDGTGIGLSIVKKIVDNHDGFIRAEGELNKGAAFHIYLPAN
jgi:PAS domain S-box-containing protein